MTSDTPIKRLEMWREGKLPDESGIAYCAGNKLFADDVMALMRELAAANAKVEALREAAIQLDAEASKRLRFRDNERYPELCAALVALRTAAIAAGKETKP